MSQGFIKPPPSGVVGAKSPLPSVASRALASSLPVSASQREKTYEEFVASLFKFMPTPTESLLHCIIGVVGEIGEFIDAKSRDNALEELGDQCYYATQLLTGLSITWEEAKTIDTPPHPATFVEASNVLDLIKKMWVYNQEISEQELRGAVRRYAACFLFTLAENDITLEEVQKLNRAKLSKRYPDGYSDKAAQLRADKLEG